MSSIVYIIPYFGKMRKDFELWLLSCKYNPEVNFLIFTDDTEKYDYPDNVHVQYITLFQVKEIFQKKFDFTISLNQPYKLCDYKPAFGELFQDYIKDYDFWGHCDMDMLWGSIKSFMTDEILAAYDKIGFLGHSTLYRNTLEVNKRYRNTWPGCGPDHRYVFTHEEGFHFDEDYMNRLYQAYGWKYFEQTDFADLTEYRHNFFLTNMKKRKNYKNQIFIWQEGHLLRKYITEGVIKEDEFFYIHFLKRTMELQLESKVTDWLMIYPNVITDKRLQITRPYIEEKSKPHWIRYFYHLYRDKKNTITAGNLPKRLWTRGRKYYYLAFHNSNLNHKESKR